MHAGKRLGQPFALKRLCLTLNLSITSICEECGSALADAFQQQYADLVLT
jgi:hypothetical protein